REEYQQLSKKYDELSKKVEKNSDSTGDSGSGRGGETSTDSNEGGRDAGSPAGGRRQTVGPDQEVGLHRSRIKFGPPFYDMVDEGFRFEDEDKEFLLRVRGLVQADTRIYEQAGQLPIISGFYLPRTRLYFDGHLTKPVEYQISLQRGYTNIDVLNAYMNFNYDKRLQLRVGRFKTPFTYEFYKYNVFRLLAPERSLFTNNFGGNRQLGIMGWGEMFDKRFEYNVGVFDGPRDSYQDFNSSKDLMSLLNFKPFVNNEGSVLQNLNIGGSVDYGYQGQGPLRPFALRTSVNASASGLLDNAASAQAGVPFLTFEPDVTEQGLRELWELHAALYYKGLSLLGAWDSGLQSYAKSGHFPVSVPINGYFVQGAYLVTGETVQGPTIIDPIHPFSLKHGKLGLGAFEPTARYSVLSLGDQVFTHGLTDKNLWTNHTSMVDVGFNWYLNKFVKIYFDWEHAMFAQPIYFAPGKFQTTSDLYWIRFQLYF
ncbi:MAG TPA: porin, partial [Isosphaeraceae bacterium]|nr:porin [Isosphaeraceae bacterium]